MGRVFDILPSGSTPTGDAHTPVPPIVSVPPVNSAVTSGTPAAAPSASAIDTSFPVTPASASGELGEILGAGEITKFTPESASGEIKRLENILIAKGADDVSRQEIIGAALEIEKALVGSDKTIRSVFNNVSKITSGAVTEIKNKAGVSGAYWKLFGENFKAIPSGSVTDNVELITEYATAYTEALKSGNPEKYNTAVVSADGKDLSAELPQTIMQNVIPTNVQNAGAYRLAATQIKNIVNDVAVQISGERAEIYGAETNTTPADAEIMSADTVSAKPKNISLTRVGDFYEAYGDEAVELANKLNLTLTPKTINGVKVQMVGFPVSSLDRYKSILGSNYNISISDTPIVTSINPENMVVTDENTPDSDTVTDTDVINHAKEIEGLKLVDTEESTLVNGKTLITGVYELNSDKNFSRKSYKKETFDIFCKAEPWIKTVDGTTYGHYGFTKSESSGYIVTYLPVGLTVTKANTDKDAKLMLKTLEGNLPELPLSIKAFGNEYRCYGLNQELVTDIKNVIDSASESASEISLPLKNKKELISYLKNHKGNKIGVSYNQDSEDIRTIISASDTAIVTERADGQQGRLSAKSNELSYTDNGFIYTGSNGMTVSYRFISEETSVSDSVTETPENEKITVDMDDETRAELLNKKSVNVVSVDAENTKALDNVDLDTLQNSYPSYARPIIKKIARDFGVLNEPFFNPDIELEFSYSGDSVQESINKQHSRYGDFVKMLSVFSDVIENAVGVETHKDKYTGTRREDTNLKQMYVLASAFNDEKGIYPVKLEVKEFKKNTNKLYLSVVLTKKESRYLSGNLGQDQLNTAPPTSTISISDLVGIVNPSEGDFLKYFPDSMLDSEQIDGKNRALAKDAERIEKISEDKKRSLATAENADALSSTPETTNSTAPTDSVSQDNDTVNKDSKVYDVAYFEKLGSDIRKGESVSLKDVRTAVDAILLNHGEAIKAELSHLKNDELKKRISVYDRGRITKKAEMVDSIYTDMLSSLYYALSGKDTITYIYDGTGFEAQQSKMLFDISRELTEESFSKRLAENSEKYQKQVAAREEKLSKVKNPQTLEDYVYKKRYFGLSDEETIQYENLYAEERRKAREDKKAAKTTKDTSGADAFFANTDNYTIEKTTHTKTGDDVWVVKPTSRLETEQWRQLNEQMKALGGSYWRGNQGWNFKNDPTAALSSTEETETATVKDSTNAEKLRAVAEGMQKAIDDKFRDRLTNTAKRAREAASAEAEGERLQRLQDTINNIADALEDGENTLLDKIDSKAQVETLMSMLRTGRRNRISETLPDINYDERLKEQDKPYSNDDAKYAEYPLTKLHESAITEYIRTADGKTGYKQITERLKKSLKSVKNGYVTVDTQMFADIDKIAQNLSTYRADFWNDGVAERKRLARMGIENVVELRAYLREFIKFLPGRNIEAEKQRTIKAKERQLANAKIEGFFPTPKAIVEKMLDEAVIKPGEKVLEPSAGKGNIADAIRENHPDNALDVVEWNTSLNELLTEKGHNVVGVDFLQHSGEYDKIIMNPPFEKGQDIDHIRHAYSLLNDGGRVVCIMSEGPFYRSDKKATEFREWLDSLGGVSEKLPEGSFKTAERSTGVNTRLVVIDKVASDTKPTKTKSGVKSSRDTATESSRADRWSTDRVDNGKENKSAVSVSEIIEQISSEFGIPISTGKVTDSEASGIYKEKPETIRTRISNNLPTISHELGHHLDKKYNLNELGSVDSIRAIVSEEFLDQYPDDAVNGELVAEFVRHYLKNKNEANRLCQEFYNDFIRSISKSDLTALNDIANLVNEYLSYDISKRYESSIISAKKAKKLQKDSVKDIADKVYTDWIYSFHPIKRLTDFVEKSVGETPQGSKSMYVLADNSLNAHAIANYVVTEGFRDLDGNILDDKKSFIECLKGIKTYDKKSVADFELYLKLEHALEINSQGKRTFADEVLENPENMQSEIARLEKEHPEFKQTAEDVYEYQYNLLKYFAVPSGLLTMQQVEYLHEKYPCYVPFCRVVDGKKGGSFARKALVKQGGLIKKLKGSGLDTLSHLESIVNNTEKIVKASLRHQTAVVLAEYADTVDGIGQFIEKVTPDIIPHSIDITALKDNFTDKLQQVIKSGEDFFAVSELLDDVFGNDVMDFTPIANESKKIISVLRNGERSYYQIHNDELFKAVTELSPKQASGILNMVGKMMRVTNALITQFNHVFAVSNLIRDIRTAYKLSEIDNPVKFTISYVKSIVDIVSKSESYKQFKAMGGGHSAELTAYIEDISKTLRRVAQKDRGKAMKIIYSLLHPIELVSSLNSFTESIPRFMEFQRVLDETGDLQKAIHAADDLTTNFKRHGASSASKVVNTMFRFNNASLQGLDRTRRAFTDAPSNRRRKIITKWLLDAILVSLFTYFYNKKVDEEGYKNLSSYKKNNFYNFAIGDGKFLSAPKERENAVLNSLTERVIDKMIGDDENAFYDFGGYLTMQLLPPMLPDTLNPSDLGQAWLGNTVIGGFVDIGTNKDFKGTPIESKYDEYLPSNERYNESTTKLAYELGQTELARDLDMSPKKIDHLISSYTGILGQVNKALFPMNDSRRDTSIGLRNKFISDSNYSTDVLNRMYENQEKAEKAFNYSGSVSDAIEYEKNSVITSYISGMNKAVKALPEDEQRNGRAYLLKALNSWNYENTASQTNMLSSLDGSTISIDVIFDELPSSTLEWTVNKQKYVYQMTPQEYHKYISDYLTVIENARKHYGGGSVESYEAAKEAAKEYMSKYKKGILKNQYFTKAVAITE